MIKPDKKLLNEYVKALEAVLLNPDGDTETDHALADALMCELLIELGYKPVVKAYYKIDKWYA